MSGIVADAGAFASRFAWGTSGIPGCAEDDGYVWRGEVTTSRCARLQEHDVVFLLPVAGFYEQRNGFTDLYGELCECGRFVV
jgi:hypothetical protein